MSSRVLLLTPSRRYIANRFGLGYQIPLGLVLLGGPLLDAGHQVKLIDNDLYGWGSRRLIEEVAAFRPDCLLMGHTGSTAAHTTALAVAGLLRESFPKLVIVYGGVYPTYAAESTLLECRAIDVVVRGEGEETAVELVEALEQGRSLATVAGITWRNGEKIYNNRSRPPIERLDDYRPGWELVDWQGYSLFGLVRSAGMQFSRGCPLTCTYCGQWGFWRRWRHRSPENIVAELGKLARQYSVKVVWLADENFASDRDTTKEVMERLIEADLGLSLNLNMTAAEVVRDLDLLPLYKKAGVDYVVMGLESLDDEVVASVRKDNPFEISKEAVSALRQNGIISLVNIIYGLEDETPGGLFTKLQKVLELDPDILNAVYITPHFWTAAGRATEPGKIIQADLGRWTYRNQVVAQSGLSPWMLFSGVKLTEALFHLRPKALLRLFRGGDQRVRRILRSSLTVGFRVVIAELAEFILSTKFVPPGTLKQFPHTLEQSGDCQEIELVSLRKG